jgi:tricarballylate dehydrogenase
MTVSDNIGEVLWHAPRERSAPPVSAQAQTEHTIDVLVVGSGNAALCAALAAAEEGADVLVVEQSAVGDRGGNSKYTRNLRCASPEPAENAYPEAAFLRDLIGVTGEGIDIDLARLLIHESVTLVDWLEHFGVHWQPALRGTLQLSATNRFFLGGGKALINTYFRAAERAGVTTAYCSRVEDLELISGGIMATVVNGGKPVRIAAKACVAASGGFEANLAWLRRDYGAAADNFIVRGTAGNDGHVLDRLLQLGAASRGTPGFHAIAVDARSPRFDGGIVTRVDSIPCGVVVNRSAKRFADEGADAWPKRYASWGALIAQQSEQIAYSIVDAKAFGQYIPTLQPPFQADSIEDLAALLQLDAASLCNEIETFNAHCSPDANDLDLRALDGNATTGLTPSKSNWAHPIDSPPFRAYPLRPGITFTYMGVAVDDRARVLLESGQPMTGIYAAGEIMAGNILRTGYLAGIGITIGAVFGRIAGREAAAHARR